MKYIFMVAAVMVMAAACHRATVPSVTNLSAPVLNTEIKNESGQTILVGRASVSAMQLPNYKSWFDDSYNKYTVDAVTAAQLKPLWENKRMEVFLGSWCGDSRREVPHMIKIFQEAGIDTGKLKIIFVDNSGSRYKQSPQHEEAGKNIHHVPSFIIYEGKNEAGRIIESPVISLEKDMLAILQHQPYQANYQAIDYWTRQVPSHAMAMKDDELLKLVPILKPLCRHSGEFNGYGYVQLAAGHTAEALNVFRLNTMIYPENTNLLDSLAEALEKTGDKKEAIVVYEKMLSANPGNESVKKKLETLRL